MEKMNPETKIKMIQLFRENRLSVPEMAKELDVTKGFLYNYFYENKKRLDLPQPPGEFHSPKKAEPVVKKEAPIDFLKERLATIKKRIAATQDYREMKLLERMIEEIEEEQEPEEFHLPEEIKSPERIEAEEQLERRIAGTEGYTRDINNTVAPNVPVGKRLEYIYDKTEEIVKAAGGRIKIKEAERKLSEMYGMVWDSGQKRLSTCLAGYKLLHPENYQLEFKRAFKPGTKRLVIDDIYYTGPQRMQAVL